MRDADIAIISGGFLLYPICSSAQLNKQKLNKLQDVEIIERVGMKIP